MYIIYKHIDHELYAPPTISFLTGLIFLKFSFFILTYFLLLFSLFFLL